MAQQQMTTHDTLLAYSEWLDGEGLLAEPQPSEKTERTHDDLARQFVEEWESNPDRSVLAGRLSIAIGRAIQRAIAQALEDK